MECHGSRSWTFGWRELCRWRVAVAGVVLVAALPGGVRAQTCQHGASIFKTCESPRRSCASDADCEDNLECTNNVCDTTLSNLTDCTITMSHADTCGDFTKVAASFDVQDLGGDNVRVPAVGNLPISSVDGNAVCCAGPALPCFVAPASATGTLLNAVTGCGDLALPGTATAGSVSFRQNTYVIQVDDPDPLPDQANVQVQDQCNVQPTGCSTGVSTVQFTASTDLVTGCTFPPKEDSTPCTDTDGNACTTAGCNGQGACDQSHIVKPCTSDACNTGQCNPTTGLCIPADASTPCPDTDGNACTVAGCEVSGEVGTCVQTHVPAPDSTPCTDTDGNKCTTAGCDGHGTCDQNHAVKTCPTTECNTGQCNTATGLCVPSPASTPCTDTDGNECTTAGCEVNGETGTCVQTHVLVPDSTPCTDTDGVECTIAGCNGSGTCDQNHIDNCGVAVCRTPGFWGTHAGTEKGDHKNPGQNITQAVLDFGGPITVCGDCLNQTNLLNKASAEEALCVSPSTLKTSPLQLARQLTAMALNCIISGFGADCSGDPDLAKLFSQCNGVCPSGTKSQIGTCVDLVDCFNNGGTFDLASGRCGGGKCANGATCTDETGCADGSECTFPETSCHNQPLVLDSELDFEPPGPASSSNKCNMARSNMCTVFGGCTSDTCP